MVRVRIRVRVRVRIRVRIRVIRVGVVWPLVGGVEVTPSHTY